MSLLDTVCREEDGPGLYTLPQTVTEYDQKNWKWLLTDKGHIHVEIKTNSA